jgi:hypothetical protein
MKSIMTFIAALAMCSCATEATKDAPAQVARVDHVKIEKSLSDVMIGKTFYSAQPGFDKEDMIDLGARIVVVSLSTGPHYSEYSSSESQDTDVVVVAKEGKKQHTIKHTCYLDDGETDSNKLVDECFFSKDGSAITKTDPLQKYRSTKWVRALKRKQPAIGMPWKVVQDILDPRDCSTSEFSNGSITHCTLFLGLRVILTNGVVTSIHSG